MGKMSLLDRLREWVGGIGFDLFLWSIRMTQDEYIDAIVRESYPPSTVLCTCRKDILGTHIGSDENCPVHGSHR